MPKSPEVPGKPANKTVALKLTADEVETLDLVRGEVSRSEWMRDRVRAELAASSGVTLTGVVTYNKREAPAPVGLVMPPEPEGTPIIPAMKGKADTPHRHVTTEVARRTVRGITVKTVKCMTCEKVWER